jgi:hypothetical protein
MSDAIQKLINAATDLFDADRAEAWRYPTVWEPVVDRLLQACQALQSGEPVAVADRGVLNWIDGKQFAREADLYTTPQPVDDVNQQLLNEIINMLIAVKGAIKLGRDADACNYINAAIAAAQESYTYSPDGKMRINKNGNFGF